MIPGEIFPAAGELILNEGAEALTLMQQGRWAWALVHSGLHLLGSLALAAAGMATAQRWWT